MQFGICDLKAKIVAPANSNIIFITLQRYAGSTWTYNAPWMVMKWSNGSTANVFVQKGSDWENEKNTIILTGLDNKGTAVWGKKNP